jgi:hypothetical protein
MKPRLSFDLAEKVSFDGMLLVVSFSFPSSVILYPAFLSLD